MVTILLVEDDDAIRVGLSRAITAGGDVVTGATSAIEAVRALAESRPDIVLLDLGLPDLDGADVLRLVRANPASAATPVIVVTARDDDREVVRLLDAGADDYLVKPFSAAQVMARVRAVMRRVAPSATEDPVIAVGDLLIEPRARSVRLAGREIPLNRKEFDLLLALASRPGEVVSKRQLLAEVWQLPWGGGDRTVEVHLSWLRRKLGETAAEPRYLHSVRGVGVKLVDATADAPGSAG